MKQYPFEHQQFTSATYPGEKGSGNYHYRGFAGLYFVAYSQKKFQDFTSWYATSISKKASPGNPEKKIDRAPKEREQLRQDHAESLREAGGQIPHRDPDLSIGAFSMGLQITNQEKF